MLRGGRRLTSLDEDALRELIGARQDKTFERLHQLVGKGYVAELGDRRAGDVVWLSSPVPTNPSLILYSDGLIAATLVTINDRDPDDPSRISNEGSADDHAFRRFLDGLKDPTWRQRTAAARGRYIWVPLIMIAFYGGFAFGLPKLLAWIWRQL